MACVVKAYLVKADGALTGEIRRFTADKELLSSYQELFQKIAEKFKTLSDGKFLLQWKDSEGEAVVFSTDEELQDALTSVEDNTFRIFVKETESRTGVSDKKRERTKKCPDEEFNPPPQFRRWMRRFLRRWHAKMAEQGGDSSNRLLDKDLISMGAKGEDGTESSEESGLSGGEQKTEAGVTAEKCKELKARGAEKRHKVYVRMLKKAGTNKGVEGIDLKFPDSSPKSGRKKYMRILLNTDDNSENLSKEVDSKDERKSPPIKEDGKKNSDNLLKPEPSPKLVKKNKKDAGKKIAEKLAKLDVSPKPGKRYKKVTNESGTSDDEQPETQCSPLISKKFKHVTFNKVKKEKTEEGDWTVVDEDCGEKSPSKDEIEVVQCPFSQEMQDLEVQVSLNKMLRMGFTNEGGWLEHLLHAKEGSILKALDTIKRNKKLAKTIKEVSQKEQ